MIQIQTFTFNGFQENTYVLFDDTKECIIVDPGCYEKHEQETLSNFVTENKLKPVQTNKYTLSHRPRFRQPFCC